MKNGIYLSIIIATTMLPVSYGMQYFDSTAPKIQGIQWKKDNFGNVILNSQDIDMEQPAQLYNCTLQLRLDEKGKALIIRLPHEEGHKAQHLLKSGFTPRYIDSIKTEWIIKNGSPIPEASTATAGARVLVCRGEDVLIIEDKNRKGYMMYPGGSVDAHELALDAACREIQEEVGLTVKSADLQKIALVNRVRANGYGFSYYCHYYMTRTFTGTVQPQESEILRAHWVPLAEIAKGESINNLTIYPLVKLLAAHVVSNHKATSMRMLDPRQSSIASDQQDQSDVMDIDLFPVNG